jgi:cytidyltransferase-like protein
MKKILVSGCYDILHGGHIEFFTQAKSLGDYLIVSFASNKVLKKYKQRESSLPEDHKKRLLESLNMIDEVVMGDNDVIEGIDFINHFHRLKPNVLVATEDDKFKKQKKELCETASWGCDYVVLEKTLNFEKVSTTDIINWIKAPKQVPLRVDFAGGWLDVPKLSVTGSYIVNCAISPLVSLNEWSYKISGGLGGSAAYAILSGKNGIKSELNMGVGWQDPAIINETGLCVWKSGQIPILEVKYNPHWLVGRMALLWTDKTHDTPSYTNNTRNYDLIIKASRIAKEACHFTSLSLLAEAIHLSYVAQLEEGMDALPPKGIARKYCGGGFGGYAVYLFENPEERDSFVNNNINAISIEPYIK